MEPRCASCRARSHEHPSGGQWPNFLTGDSGLGPEEPSTCVERDRSEEVLFGVSQSDFVQEAFPKGFLRYTHLWVIGRGGGPATNVQLIHKSSREDAPGEESCWREAQGSFFGAELERGICAQPDSGVFKGGRGVPTLKIHSYEERQRVASCPPGVGPLLGPEGPLLSAFRPCLVRGSLGLPTT